MNGQQTPVRYNQAAGAMQKIKFHFPAVLCIMTTQPILHEQSA
ncbi:MAG: hypothetical protein OJF51_004998 [Nitrospira sp.]|nr:MAG: hypothetical protein OJF51_004998 [Nitrospira sp.]